MHTEPNGRPMLTVYHRENEIRIRLADAVKHRYLHWPESLIEVELELPERFTVEHLRLFSLQTDDVLPIQVRAVAGNIIKLYFIAGLESGQSNEYRLVSDPSILVTLSSFRQHSDEDSVILDNGSFQVRLPLGNREGADLPGPIMRLGRNNRWVGTSKLDSRNKEPIAMSSECLHSGPLFAEYEVRYLFEKQASYTVHIRFGAGMEYVQICETIDGLTLDDQASWRMELSDLAPRYRYSLGHPSTIQFPVSDEPLYEPIDMELDVSDSYRIPMSLAPYDPLSQRGFPLNRRVPFAAFWEGGDDPFYLGWFVKHSKNWQDGEYRIWQSSHTLSIKYYLADWGLGGFRAVYPLVNGTRTTALLCYGRKQETAVSQRYSEWKRERNPHDTRPVLPFPLGFLHYTYLHQELLGLDKMKHWVLHWEQDDHADRSFLSSAHVRSGEDLYNRVFKQDDLQSYPESDEISKLALYGVMGVGIDPVSLRDVHHNWLGPYLQFAGQLDEQRRNQLHAALCLLAYICSDEAFMPIRNMLAGHPNFLSDVRALPAEIAYLFPAHPDARQWIEQFEFYLKMNTVHHIRPDVEAWNAIGGRWTENAGCYAWAFLKPTLFASWALHHYGDGMNRLATKEMAAFSRWLLNSITSPIRHPVRGGLERMIPPQGAHAGFYLRTMERMWMLGYELRRYEPELAEHLMWAVDYVRTEGVKNALPLLPAEEMGRPDLEKFGTPPVLTSLKQTGYGLTMRSKFGEPDEVFVFLQQIDRGPNYRWGQAGAGGNGVIYYYAAGKRYSHNGPDDVGDRKCEDTERASNFGVLKKGVYRSIGPNTLHAPFYTFPTAQYGIVYSDPQPFEENSQYTNHEQLVRSPQPYSWPEYISRSVLLAGSDYIMIYDAVRDDQMKGRFSWFTKTDEQFPSIHQLKPGVNWRDVPGNGGKGDPTKGRWYEGRGDFLTVVTHQTLQTAPTDYGCTVIGAGWKDWVFRSQKEICFACDDLEFRGRAGWIRQKNDRSYELAMFDGNRIAAGGIRVGLASESGAGITLSYPEFGSGGLHGRVQSEQGCEVTWYWPCHEGMKLFVDGKETACSWSLDTAVVRFPSGVYNVQFTKTAPKPEATIITHSHQYPDGAVLFWQKAVGAEGYQVDWRLDEHDSVWQSIHVLKDTTTTITGLTAGRKYIARIVPFQGDAKGEWSPLYPLYPTHERAFPPDGLSMEKRKDRLILRWGKVLGASIYRLYRRSKGENGFVCLYEGTAVEFEDLTFESTCEYVVTAENGVGEGPYSKAVCVEKLVVAPPNGGKFRRNFSVVSEPAQVEEYPV